MEEGFDNADFGFFCWFVLARKVNGPNWLSETKA